MIHRDDVPFEEIEKMEREIREQSGNKDAKIFFAGDLPAGKERDEITAQIKEIEEINAESVQRGFCIDCLQAMPIYKAWDEEWEPDDGWVCMFYPNEEPAGWMCPFCVNEMTGGDDEFDEDERWTITDKDELEGDFE